MVNNVFLLSPNPEYDGLFIFSDSADYDSYHEYQIDCSGWRPREISRVNEEGKTDKEFIPIENGYSILTPGIVIVGSQVERERLLSVPGVALLPVFYFDENYWILHVNRKVNCINHNLSKFERLQNGKRIRFSNLTLRENAVPRSGLFRIHEIEPFGIFSSQSFFEDNKNQNTFFNFSNECIYVRK